jgi:hypothetical protein
MKYLFLFFPALFCLLITTNAQTIYVKQSSGTQTSYAISGLRMITFSSGNLEITKTDNNSTTLTVAGLDYLSFTDYKTDIQMIYEDAGTIRIYPNPVDALLNIELPEAGTVHLLSLDGKVILTRQVNTSGITIISIKHIQAGIYICRYTNGKEIKTAKIIKQ